jgi:alpha-L-rhamnosidase
MKSLKFLLCLLFIPSVSFSQELSTYDLTFEHRINPVGTDILQPRLSWKIKGSGNNIMQTAYSLRVAVESKFSASKIIWQSGKVASDESVLVSYKGPDLKACQRY